MAGVLWRGSWATRLRIASGLVLFVYALTHFLNIGVGTISPRWLDVGQDLRQLVTRSLAGTVLLYGAFLVHGGLALTGLAGRRTLRMPATEALQVALGLVIPVLLAVHLVHTRLAHEVFDVNDRMAYIMGLIWGTRDGWKQSALMLVVWVHGCIGLSMWLRALPWWRRAQPWFLGAAVLVPAFALAGFMTEGRRIRALLSQADDRAALRQSFNWPDSDTFQALAGATSAASWTVWALLGLAALVYAGRRMLGMRRSVRVRYVDGPTISAPRGMTLLEISRSRGVPHTSLCGGRGRCTTCRVVVEQGAEYLPPPSETEARSLRAVRAPAATRLACQVRPAAPLTVFRVFQPDGRRTRAHASQGQERRLAILFLDIRGFTARTTGQLPYDVVFLLNRFFDAIVPAITRAGGTVDKYMGDGLLAMFETADEASSASAALTAAADIGAALHAFNAGLEAEGAAPIRIGVGLHLGNVVLGEIGAAGQAPRTIIGDTVNAASRLESMTKDLGIELLVSQTLLRAAGLDTSSLTLSEVALRGVAEPVQVLPVAKLRDLDALIRPA